MDIKESIDLNYKELYNLTTVIEMCRGNQESVLKLIKVFILEISKSVEQLNVAYKEANIGKIKEEIHKVKPTLTYFGTGEIRNELINLETLVHRNSPVYELEKSIYWINSISKLTVAKMKKDFSISNN